MNKYPEYTSDIYEHLKKGLFICENSKKPEIKRLYKLIQGDLSGYSEYFAAIKLILEGGDGYYYFSGVDSNDQIEAKLTKVARWLDIVDLLQAFDVSFGPGYRFIPANILSRLGVAADLKSKLESIGATLGVKGSHRDILDKIIGLMVKDNVIELQNEIGNEYKVLYSYQFIQQLLLSFTINFDEQNETPE